MREIEDFSEQGIRKFEVIRKNAIKRNKVLGISIGGIAFGMLFSFFGGKYSAAKAIPEPPEVKECEKECKRLSKGIESLKWESKEILYRSLEPMDWKKQRVREIDHHINYNLSEIERLKNSPRIVEYHRDVKEYRRTCSCSIAGKGLAALSLLSIPITFLMSKRRTRREIEEIDNNYLRPVNS